MAEWTGFEDAVLAFTATLDAESLLYEEPAFEESFLIEVRTRALATNLLCSAYHLDLAGIS